MKDIINKLINKTDLTGQEAGNLLDAIMCEELSPVQTASVLTALRMKGETTEEIASFIGTLRKNMVKINAAGAVDVCGTGGDGKGTFNISTAVSFVLAAAGIKVAKHGNRAASSKSGSADVLESLGMKIDLNASQAEKVLQKTGFVFLFAPLYHPAYKPVALVRKELKFPTVFNYLGPFINPASVKRQLIGVSNLKMAEKLAEVSKSLNFEHLLIVSSHDGLDEVSIFAPTTIFEIKGSRLKKYDFVPTKFGFTGKFADITGGDAGENTKIMKDVFSGVKGARRDIVLLNSAFAFLMAGKVKSVDEGVILSAQMIDNGLAIEKMNEVVEETKKV